MLQQLVCDGGECGETRAEVPSTSVSPLPNSVAGRGAERLAEVPRSSSAASGGLLGLQPESSTREAEPSCSYSRLRVEGGDLHLDCN